MEVWVKRWADAGRGYATSKATTVNQFEEPKTTRSLPYQSTYINVNSSIEAQWGCSISVIAANDDKAWHKHVSIDRQRKQRWGQIHTWAKRLAAEGEEGGVDYAAWLQHFVEAAQVSIQAVRRKGRVSVEWRQTVRFITEEAEVERDTWGSDYGARQSEVQQCFSINYADIMQALLPNIVVGQRVEQFCQAPREVKQPLQQRLYETVWDIKPISANVEECEVKTATNEQFKQHVDFFPFLEKPQHGSEEAYVYCMCCDGQAMVQYSKQLGQHNSDKGLIQVDKAVHVFLDRRSEQQLLGHNRHVVEPVKIGHRRVVSSQRLNQFLGASVQ